MLLLRKLCGVWEFVFQLLLNNNLPLYSAEEKGHNKSSTNPSCALHPLINNIINSHDDDDSSDGTKNEDCDDQIRSSTVKCVSHESW